MAKSDRQVLEDAKTVEVWLCREIYDYCKSLHIEPASAAIGISNYLVGFMCRLQAKMSKEAAREHLTEMIAHALDEAYKEIN